MTSRSLTPTRGGAHQPSGWSATNSASSSRPDRRRLLPGRIPRSAVRRCGATVTTGRRRTRGSHATARSLNRPRLLSASAARPTTRGRMTASAIVAIVLRSSASKSPEETHSPQSANPAVRAPPMKAGLRRQATAQWAEAGSPATSRRERRATDRASPEHDNVAMSPSLRRRKRLRHELLSVVLSGRAQPLLW